MPDILDYFGPKRTWPPPKRISKLAIVSLIVGIVGSPCIYGPLLPKSKYIFISLSLIPMTGVVLSTIALLRIPGPYGQRRGAALAWWGFALSLIWFGLAGCVSFVGEWEF